jgi:hypothetical protein
MYTKRGGLTLGFHGCDVGIMESVVSGQDNLKESRNRYDWLGHGIYFWEFSPYRALQFASELNLRSSSKIQRPSALGAVIDLGHCLDLLDYQNLSLVRLAYDMLVQMHENLDLPQNRSIKDSHDFLLRDLDCAVIEMLHKLRVESGESPFDSVRGAFWEGKELYPNAGFREKDHIQICIRNPNCIKGLFLPRKEDSRFAAV